MEADKDGVRIAELDEMSYRRLLWGHKPLTDFWRIGKGTARRLAKMNIFTMGDLARESLYNEDYAKTLGINITLYQFLISLMTALIIVTGMRIMGTLLISGLIILPAVTARGLAKSFRSLVMIAALISFLAFVSGLALSFVLNLPAGSSVILADTIILILVKILS